MTAAAIEALSNFKSLNGVNNSISNWELYLKEEQKSDGSFGNISSTSWAIQALSLNSSYNEQVNKAIKYLSNEQQDDGGLILNDSLNNRIWATSYVIPAVLKLSWNDILKSFSKVENIKQIVVSQIPTIEKNILNRKEEIKSELTDKKKVITVENKEINKKPIKKLNSNKLSSNDYKNNNLLSASASGSTQNSNTFFSIIHKIIQKVEKPFLWFYNQIHFFNNFM